MKALPFRTEIFQCHLVRCEISERVPRVTEEKTLRNSDVRRKNSKDGRQLPRMCHWLKQRVSNPRGALAAPQDHPFAITEPLSRHWQNNRTLEEVQLTPG
ncbi:hypothetical protein TNCV_2555431 [Trichonephila clavipes]|nr:hypothetical protein TNCV_2555431 [Trichonephila clavipes]